MYISRVSLVNYRNFERANVFLGAGVNTIIGENGSGKSNLFRAIRLLLDDAFVARRHDLRESDFHRGLSDWRGHWIVIMIEFGEVSDDESVQSLLLHHLADDSREGTAPATYALVFRPNVGKRNELSKVPDGDHKALEAVRNTITIDDYERVLFGKMSVDLTDPDEYVRIVGDFDRVAFPSWERNSNDLVSKIGIPIQREMALWREFSLSYVPALRDVIGDFNDPRKNPLRTLLSSRGEGISEDIIQPILKKVQELNQCIEETGAVQEIERDVHKTFKQMVGETYSPTHMEIRSELPSNAVDLFRSLRLYVNENDESALGRLHEMSLGGANLVYLTLKLLEFQYQSKRQAIANFLLIEEPEAHIHTHVQKTLFDHVVFENTQIIYSTHSAHISEASKIRQVNVLARIGESWDALQPSAGLGDKEINAAQRYLDATRCNLLFARSVMLVEGDAEEILIPSLVKKIYGVSLDEIGVSLVNIGSTGFINLANLFHKDRLRKRCAIVTDRDAKLPPVSGLATDREDSSTGSSGDVRSAKSGEDRKRILDEFCAGNEYVEAFYADHTFEVDLAAAAQANRELLKSVVDEVYKQTRKRKEVKKSLDEEAVAVYGSAALRLAKKCGKGWFALLLSESVDNFTSAGDLSIPDYIIKALRFAVHNLPAETWMRIFKHRIAMWGEREPSDEDNIESTQADVENRFARGDSVEKIIRESATGSWGGKALEQLID